MSHDIYNDGPSKFYVDYQIDIPWTRIYNVNFDVGRQILTWAIKCDFSGHFLGLRVTYIQDLTIMLLLLLLHRVCGSRPLGGEDHKRQTRQTRIWGLAKDPCSTGDIKDLILFGRPYLCLSRGGEEQSQSQGDWGA